MTIIIYVFTVDPTDQQRLIRIPADATETLVRLVPGSV